MWTDVLNDLFANMGFAALTWKHALMLFVAFALIYLAIAQKFEPLLLLPIAFGILLANLPLTGLMAEPADGQPGGVLYYLYQGVKLGIYPSLIFLGIGAMTDFGPLLARPSSLFMGAGAQFGISIVFLLALALGMRPGEAASAAIIAGADGPTAIFLTTRLAPDLLPAVAVAAYSYMALIPLIQPPLMRLLTTEKERAVKMEEMRIVSKLERVCFPVAVTLLCALLLPAATPLIGMLMLGNLLRESGVTQRLSDTAQNGLINTVTIFLGVTVGATANAETFLRPETLKVIALGLFGFTFSTVGGLLLGKIMYRLSGGKINPLIGSAGVSAVPMAARVSNREGLRANPSNYLLMHAMGP
ncbi:MAG TPA: sodium ion-translocating decarboxylase subunit beta, partial [Clostridia bacterium]|nr:sodium ion-translocating decarboxylase subunit beta [Clostridia bacterium]